MDIHPSPLLLYQYRIPISIFNIGKSKVVKSLEDRVLRKLFLGFIHIHILHHAKEEPIYGTWMLHELQEHGYQMSSGTLYPIFHSMEKDGLLEREDKKVEGKIRKYYSITPKGITVLDEARNKAYELFKEIKD